LKGVLVCAQERLGAEAAAAATSLGPHLACFHRLPYQQDRLRRTNELVDRLAQSEARASEAEKQAQQKEADLRRKLEELALAGERAVSAVNGDGDFPRFETSTGEPAEFRFSQLDELRYAINLRSDDLTTVLPVAAGLSVAALVAVGSVALNAKVGEPL
jgi:hypothetical protein